MVKTRPQIALTFGKRILIVLCILFGMMVGVLEFAEGMKEPLRLGLQDYLTQVSDGNPAEITNLDKSELFPKTEFSLKGIIIRDKADSSKTLVNIDQADIVMSYWKTLLGLADYRKFEITQAEFATGYLLPQKLSLAFAGISDPSPESSPPYFVFDGQYNNRSLLITAEMERSGKKEFSYDFASEFPVTFKLGNTEASARFRRNLTSVDFAQMVITNKVHRVLLRTEGVVLDPLHIRFIGEMGEFPLAGELQNKDGNYNLYIVPGSDNPQFLKELAAFVAATRADLGIPDGDEHIKIEIRAPDVAQQGTDKNKEKAAE